jgi:hypothetical protein
MSCACAACRGGVAPVRASDRYLTAHNAKVRASLGKPAVPVMGDLPAELRAFVGGL